MLALPEDVRVCMGDGKDVDVDDILLDTGCSRTFVRRELEKFRVPMAILLLIRLPGGPGC